ncbi:MAG: type IV pilus secretin PilQ [Pyrinomonadaceae bacterium]
MNSLTKLCSAVKEIVLAMALVSTLAVSILAQNVEPQSQGRHYGEPGFRGEPIDLNVVNADIRDILSYITDQYGVNFVIDKSVKEVPVTVKVKDIPWNIALDSVLQAHELGVQVNGNILRIADNKTLASEGELYRDRQNNQLDTSPLITEMIRLNYASVTGSPSPGSASSGKSNQTGSQWGGGGMMNSGITAASAIGGSDGGMGNNNSNSGLLPIIKRRLSRRGSIEVDDRTNSLIITDVAANVAAVKQLIGLLDQPEPQVEIEARIVVATRTFSRELGVQLFAMLNGARGSGIQAGTLPPNSGGGGASGASLNGLPAGPGLPRVFGDAASTVIGLTTGIFGTASLSALITAGEQRGQAKVIATPRVTALNNEPAKIESKSQVPIVTIQPGSGLGGAPIATTTYVDVPLSLQITPQITDHGTVILTVTAENSSTGPVVGGLAPSISTQNMSTRVVVPDGGTTVVGGVLFDDERETQDRTPGLASVPLLGNLFKRKGLQRNTNEILFFITPRITRPEETARQTTPRGVQIIQPVPMGNPPSNSSPVIVDPLVLQPSGLPRSELVTPRKPNN